MEDNIYRAPESTLVDRELEESEFYVVSKGKFIILFVATFGLYAVYWFYAHWRAYKIKNSKSLWPIPRAIFYIFFTHSLFKLISEAALDVQSALHWNHRFSATICVIFSVLSTITDRLSQAEIGEPYASIFSLVSIPVIGWTLYRAQLVANIACRDVDAIANNKLTVYNYFWILFGLAFWAMFGLGIYIIFFGMPEFV